MAKKEYIEREAFIADKKWLYCTDCDKRKGKKRGKMVTLYEIGEAPCKSCGIHDMLEEVEMYPAADVRPVVLCRDCKHSDTFAPDCTEATFPLKCLSIRYGGVYPNWFCEHGEMREES